MNVEQGCKATKSGIQLAENTFVAEIELKKITDTSLIRDQAFIGGIWCEGAGDGRTFVTNPANDKLVASISNVSAPQVSNAIDSAYQTQKGWKQLLVDERGSILRKWHQLILDNKEDLARLMVIEQGKTLAEALGEIDYGASFVLWFAEEARRAYGETIPSHIPGAQLATMREPIGVAALITPWNFPCAMITRKAAAALAIGCTIVVKPASETPLSALALAVLAERAGFPAGAFNVLTGDAAMISEILCASDKVKALSFTGSTRVGQLLLARASNTVKKCSMELGGNAPFIILDDMDMAQAAKAAADAKFQTSGQDCLAANRIFVPQAHYESFLQHFKKEVETLRVGNGFDPNVNMGPLIHKRAAQNAAHIVEDAVAKGARLITGDQTMSPGPNYYMPTLLADVTPDMLVYTEENFCPVAGVIAYDDIDSLITMANDTEYGLAAYIYSNDLRRIWALLPELEYGMISVNSVKMTGPPIPFGGVKQSGLGREGSCHGLDEFSEIKYYCLGDLHRNKASA